ncbi:hypothetical protein RZS08_29935, partial [Arthrospira platensis SPKY1]|nr:hypothetical protein [Arthrospira platensis SPKY1]
QHIGQHQRGVGQQQAGPQAFPLQPQHQAVQAHHPEHARQHQRQVEQGTQRPVPVAGCQLQPGDAPQQRQQRRGRGEHQRVGDGACAGPDAEPGLQRPGLGQQAGKRPNAGHAAHRQGQQEGSVGQHQRT